MNESEPGSWSTRRLLALVIEDAVTERTLLGALARREGMNVMVAPDAESALAATRQQPPDIILLDIHLPDRDGLVLLSDLREELPFVPVVVVSATDNREHVEEALHLGAVNFLRKPIRAEEFRFVLNRIAKALAEEEGLQDVLKNFVERETRMTLPGDPMLVPRVVALLGRDIRMHYPAEGIPLPDIKLALYEALANAIEHGNLDIDYEDKREAMRDATGLDDLIRGRMADSKYADRRVRVVAKYRQDAVEYLIHDEGSGFDPTGYDTDAALADTESLHGRGLALIHHYMDTVSWNDSGTEIHMTRYLGERARAH